MKPKRCTARTLLLAALLPALLAAINACESVGGQPATAPGETQMLKVVATTTIVGDVVAEIGGDAIELTVLLPAGVDPHAFDPTPQDAAAVADADVIIINGLGLEEFLEPLLENVGSRAAVVSVSDGVGLREFAGRREHDEVTADPHVWLDPGNVIVWTENIEQTLSRLDPVHASGYHANARAYRDSLAALDAWIEKQVSSVPRSDRKLVTDHHAWGYFVARYGFEQVGAVIPGFSAAAEPSARELARLEDAVRDLGVSAIFVGTTVSPALARRVAEDTGTRLVALYTGSLSEPGGPADSYLSFMRFNVSAIVDALR